MGGYWRDLPIEIQKEYMGGSFKLEGGKQEWRGGYLLMNQV